TAPLHLCLRRGWQREQPAGTSRATTRTETNAEEQDELRCQEAVPGHRVREGHAPAGPPRAQVPGAQRASGRSPRERRGGRPRRPEEDQEAARQVTPAPDNEE